MSEIIVIMYEVYPNLFSAINLLLILGFVHVFFFLEANESVFLFFIATKCHGCISLSIYALRIALSLARVVRVMIAWMFFTQRSCKVQASRDFTRQIHSSCILGIISKCMLSNLTSFQMHFNDENIYSTHSTLKYSSFILHNWGSSVFCPCNILFHLSLIKEEPMTINGCTIFA